MSMGYPAPISFHIPTKDAATQTVSMSGTSARMATAFTQDGYAIVTVTADCFVIMGTSASAPVATVNSAPLLAARQYRIASKYGYKLAFIMASGTGTAYVTEELAG